jgi:hypothetical protein
MKNILLGLVVIQFVALSAFAQNETVDAGAAQRTFVGGTYLGTFQPKESDPELMPEFKAIRNKVNKSDNEVELLKYKDSLNKLKLAAGILPEKSSNKTTASIDPVKTFGFNALGTQGTPSDNTLAVGKSGSMIAAVNSSMRTYSTTGTGGALKYFANFWDPVTSKNDLCDPLTYYDPNYDRFILFTQICDRSTADNKILMAFSTTNNPAGSYHFYSFRSNLREVIGINYPYDVWFDYPKMAVSASDVFVTGNLFRNTSSTSSSYVESVIFQIDKAACFAGNVNPYASVFNSLSGGPFTVTPAGHGRDGHYGDVMHFCASRNGNSNNYIRMYTVTGKVASNPSISTATVTLPTYSPPADGVQKGTNILLNTGDSRGMNAMYVDGTVHFVFHCDGPSNYVAINYSRLRRSGNTWAVQNKVISFPGVDCAYPSVASMGWNDADQAALIVFDYSSLNDYPGIRAVFLDHYMYQSNYIELNTGTGYINYGIDNQGRTRWGDYSGISREHNASTPTVWGHGMYGKSSGTWSNYISEIKTVAWPIGTNDIKREEKKATIFPNPVIDTWNIELNIEEAGDLKVVVFDMQGKKVKDVFARRVSPGASVFSFNKNGLSNGTYFVKVFVNDSNIANEKIIVAK